MRELVKAIDLIHFESFSHLQALGKLTSGAPDALRRAVARPFEAVWDFQETALNAKIF